MSNNICVSVITCEIEVEEIKIEIGKNINKIE